jgi:hypothetical protein
MKTTATLTLLFLCTATTTAFAGDGGAGDGGVADSGSADSGIIPGDWSINPSQQRMKLYEFWASTSPLCTNPVRVFKNENPDWVDLLGKPKLGSGPLAEGTYPCVIGVVSDTLKFAPATSSSSGHCVAGTVYQWDLCRDGGSSLLPDGTTTACATGSEDKIAFYLSVAGPPPDKVQDAAHPPEAPENAKKGIRLYGPLIVRGDTHGVLYNDATGGIHDNGDACELGATKGGFR